MTKLSGAGLAGLAILALAGCGTRTLDRAASGAAIGGATGVVFGGVGAIPGAIVGAGVGAITDEKQINLGKPVWDD